MLFINIMGIIGTAAFAVSGVLVGIKNKLDLFGVFVLAILTASGGGLIRDVIIGEGQPVFFTEPKYLFTIIITMILTCFVFKFIKRLMIIIKIFDAIGLGIFTILATNKAISLSMPLIGIVFIAALTGIGGGVLRDILVNDVPLVFKSEIYALAAILGALSFYFLNNYIDVNLNVYICVTIIFTIRVVAIYFNLNLPRLRFMKDEED
jgi:uncharacterized membrane protein YeiH